jgi:hypothetical protein
MSYQCAREHNEQIKRISGFVNHGCRENGGLMNMEVRQRREDLYEPEAAPVMKAVPLSN